MSDLLNKASLVMVPSGYKEDTVYSVVPTDGSGDLSFARASNGTRVNSAGLVEVAPWNLLTYSEDLSNGAWAPQGSSVTTDSTTAPNGTTTADTLIESNTTDEHNRFQTINISGQHTFSVYLKKYNVDWCALYVFNPSVGGIRYWINVNTLTAGTSANIGGGIGTTSLTLESVGNGWVRASILFNNPSGDCRFYVANAQSDGGATTYAGNGTNGVYVWGAQVNLGTLKPYFPTTDRLNVPRLTYQNGGGGCPSLLLEKQSTNLFSYSEQLDNGFWTPLQITITANNTTSPDGTQNADKITEDAVNGVHLFYNTSAVTGSATSTASIFYKKGTRRYFSVKLQIDSNSYTQVFDADGVTTGSNSSNGLTSVSTSIVSMGNGWVRASVTGTDPSASTACYMICSLSNSATPTFDSGNFNPSYSGSTSEYGYFWGAQVESGSYATSYIPTTSSSATRVADACSKTGISSLIGGTSGTVFFDIKTNPVLTSDNYKQFFYYTDSSAAQGYMYLNSGNGIVTNISLGNLSSSITLSPNTRYKIALTYANNDFALYVNGTSVATASSGTPLNFENLLSLGSYTGTSEWNEFVFNQYTHFKSRLTNAELASLTTI